MSKQKRIKGSVQPFASEAVGQERTIFGSNTINNDVDLQIQAEFRRGWGIVGPTDAPSIQDFNALGYTLSKLISYLYEQGVPEWSNLQTYYTGGICAVNGVIYSSKLDDNTANDPEQDAGVNWEKHLRSADATDEADADSIVKRNSAGTFQVSTPTALKHPVRKKELDDHKSELDAHDASNIKFNNVESGLVAVTVQAAIDESLNQSGTALGDHEASTTAHAAEDITYSNTLSGLGATNTQNAIDEVTSRMLLLEDITLAASVTWDMAADTYSGTPRATPAHKSMRRCTVRPDGTVNYYLDEFDSTKKEDGTAAVLDGTDGQVMVEIGKVYVKTSFKGNKATYEVSSLPLAGFTLHPAFHGGVEKTYIGAYDATVFSNASSAIIDGLNSDNNTARVNLINDKLCSASGNYAMVGLTRDEFRKLARNNGYQIYDYWQWQLVQMLWITEYGNWNSQEVLGRGNVDRSYLTTSNIQGDSPHIINGLSNQFGNNSGSVATADGEPFVTYRGIENVWGNAWQFIDGVNVEDLQLYVSNDEDTYVDDVKTGEYSALGSPIPIASNSPIKSWQKVQNAFIPEVVNNGASTATFIGDAFWSSEIGWRTLFVGGNANSALSAGLSCCNASSAAASTYNRNISSRLSKKLRS